ncbi:hypothetical protein [Hymenobacter sp. CRA2]|uniref:hypothetical protein n=1 Tax=Hymenobacter sp. CRA2 TaxID=1955620 RepID=UPI00098EC957|nr:hypothetical protein [Hymenobacter sp. CRA2]OON68106.1 hypothetical protein B0919_15750 [Hymenobacter sp. CRA2]
MPLTLPQVVPTREYRIAKGWRLLFFVLCPIIVAAFVWLPFDVWLDEKTSATAAAVITAMSLGLVALFGYGLAAALRYRLVVGPDRITERNAFPFRSKELLFEDIKGFRVDQNYTFIEPRRKGLPKLSYVLEQFDELQRWLYMHFNDLAALQQQEEEQRILADDTLGSTTDERAAKLAAARKTATIVNVAGGVAGAWLFLQPEPYRWATAAGLLVPLAAAGTLWLHPGVLRLGDRKSSAYPSISPALIFPSLGLILRSLFDQELVRMAPLWPLVGVVAALLAVALLLGNRQTLRQRGTALMTISTAVFCAALYGYGATTMYNAAFDEAEPAVHLAKVLKKHKSSGRTTTYNLTVTPWGPIKKVEDVQVSRAYYEQTQPGDSVSILLMSGRLDLPWYTVGE